MDQFAPTDAVSAARALHPVVSAAADQIERTRRFPVDLLEALHTARIFRMLLPHSVGGDEVAPWVYLAAVEEIALADASVGWNVFVGNSAALIAPLSPGARRMRLARAPCPGGIASPAGGISPAVAGRRPGWGGAPTWWSRTGRCGAIE